MAARFSRWMAAALVGAGMAAGCGLIGTSPDMGSEWKPLLDDIRVFQRRIGFEDTDNFLDLSKDQESFSFCGQVSRWYLPYSYEDPAIKWQDGISEEQCRNAAADSDIYYGASEALGEVGTPATISMVTGKLDRFVYLVIHEDCHDQFDLPYGIEEALCNVIAYKGMAQFAEQKFKWYAGEGRAIRRYADEQSKSTRAIVGHYAQLAALYARHARGELAPDALLRERAEIFARSERVRGWPAGYMNNVSIANDMTYSRHYPFLENVFNALEGDLARTVAFFRQVDKIRPAPQVVLKRERIASENSVEFVRAYEAVVLEIIRNLLAAETGVVLK